MEDLSWSPNLYKTYFICHEAKPPTIRALAPPFAKHALNLSCTQFPVWQTTVLIISSPLIWKNWRLFYSLHLLWHLCVSSCQLQNFYFKSLVFSRVFKSALLSMPLAESHSWGWSDVDHMQSFFMMVLTLHSARLLFQTFPWRGKVSIIAELQLTGWITGFVSGCRGYSADDTMQI